MIVSTSMLPGTGMTELSKSPSGINPNAPRLRIQRRKLLANVGAAMANIWCGSIFSTVSILACGTSRILRSAAGSSPYVRPVNAVSRYTIFRFSESQDDPYFGVADPAGRSPSIAGSAKIKRFLHERPTKRWLQLQILWKILQAACASDLRLRRRATCTSAERGRPYLTGFLRGDWVAR